MDKGKAPIVEDAYVGIDALRVGIKSQIKVMVCRKWDVINAQGKYRSTGYILSDEQRKAIHCSARSNISHCFVSKLEEDIVYSIEGFSIAPPKDNNRIRHSDECVIDLEGYSIVKLLDCCVDGFVRFPFQLVPLDGIHLNDSTFLIDVMGCVIDVGMVRTINTGSELLEFHLIGNSGTRVRVTLWGALSNDFLSRPVLENRTYIIILPSMNVKEYHGELYLSSLSATTIFDSLDIPQIASLHEILTDNSTPATYCMPPPMVTRSVSLSKLIRLGKEQNETRCQIVMVQCKVRIESFHTKDSWFYFSCGSGGCKKKLGHVGTGFGVKHEKKMRVSMHQLPFTRECCR